MPRGDHRPGCCRKNQPCKRYGEPRERRRTGEPPQKPSGVLAARQEWFDSKHNGLEEIRPNVKKPRGEGGTHYRRPGSQRKGR